MVRKNRTIAEISALILILACGLFLAYRIEQQNSEQAQLESRSAELKEQNKEIQNNILAKKQEVLSQTTDIGHIRQMEETAAATKENYYKVARQLEDAVISGQASCKIAYLTFDDGPYLNTTGKYLDVLDQYGILATFFQIGRPAEELDPVYRRVYESGHTVANHTYSHQIRNGIYRGVDYFISDVIRNREFIEEKLGITTDILRFPGGSPSAGAFKPAIVEELRKLGYGYVDWNSATGDGVQMMTPAEYRDNVLNKTGGRNILVVLMHDCSANTLAALPEIIEGLQDQGYIFLPLFYESSMVNK